ncbi:MAG TPA: hypothetical protein VGX94_09295 [Terriglobia bacterium]|nr:hypothetical protein [Terriglobia bacterium]
MIDRSIGRKARLLMDQQWLGRREAVEILPKDDPGATENSEKKNV